jgi:hypothetical protein
MSGCVKQAAMIRRLQGILSQPVKPDPEAGHFLVEI